MTEMSHVVSVFEHALLERVKEASGDQMRFFRCIMVQQQCGRHHNGFTSCLRARSHRAISDTLQK